MCFRDTCDLASFLPPAGVTHYWCYKNLISDCPPEFEDWRVGRQCREGVSSWVYYGNDTVYRNSYCAICNLGDEIIKTRLEQLEDVVGSIRWLYGYVIKYEKDIIVAKEKSQRKLDVDLNNNTCCTNGFCNFYDIRDNNDWGEIGAYNQCLSLPFNRTCSSDFSQEYQSINLSYTSLCSQQLPVFPHNPITVPIAVPNKFPLQNVRSLSYGAFFFGDVGLVTTYVIEESDWTEINNSATLCSDKGLVDLSTKTHFNQFKLTSNKILVRISENNSLIAG